jgi:probable rRNA maturation factor
VAVEISWRDDRVRIEERLIRELVDLVARGEGRALPVSVTIVDDAEIRRIHREFLGMDEPTDVIAFDLSAGPDPTVGGEVVVSAECAEMVARELGHAPDAELLFYVCHGLLHLCGWNDASAADRARMHSRQRDYLAALGVTIGP